VDIFSMLPNLTIKKYKTKTLGNALDSILIAIKKPLGFRKEVFSEIFIYFFSRGGIL